MARLPTTGTDDGQWGNLLNQFLQVSHNADGTPANVVNVVANVAALKALSVTVAAELTSVYVKGYYAMGDGGEGVFAWDATSSETDNGGTILAANAGGVGRWKRLGAGGTGSVSVKQFGVIADGVADDTVAFQRALDYLPSQTSAGLISVNGVSSAYAGTLPRLRLPQGRLRITSALNCGAYMSLDGDDTIIEQATAGADILTGEAYLWKVRGVVLVGGRHQVNIWNANTGASLFDFDACEFHLSSDYAVKTAATGGVWLHLSANLTFRKCRFLMPRMILDNCCDSAVFDDCWVQIEKTNFSPATAAIRNKGDTSHPRLFLRNFFGVPAMGVAGLDRLADVRWIDNYGSVYATGCRFGGEDAGLSICWHYIAPPTTTPFLGYEIVFDDCWLLAGPSARNDSGVVVLQGQLPHRISIQNCFGPTDVPFVINPGTIASLGNYYQAWETATGQKAYNAFCVNIRGNTTSNPEGIFFGSRIPFDMYPYVVGSKQTRVRRAASQSIAQGFGNNLVSFDTVEADNVGAFALANPTRLVMPLGCTRMRITASGQISTDGTSKVLAITIVDSGITRISGDTVLRGINPDTERFSIAADVEGVPGQYWHVNVQHNAAAALNLLDCRVSLTPLDHIG